MNSFIRKFYPVLLLVTPIICYSASDENSDSSCELKNISCLAKDNIAVVSDDTTAAAELLSVARQGSLQYQKYFGENTLPIAIVPGGSVNAALQNELKQTGYTQILPWISKEDQARLQEASIIKQLEAQLQNQPDHVRDAAMAQAMAQLASSDDSGKMDSKERAALTHELGHLWFMAAFPSDSEGEATTPGYGGWAPDWLDEAVAILLENDDLTESRRKALLETEAKDLIPMNTLFSMEHPAMNAVPALIAEKLKQNPDETMIATVLTGEEADAFLKASGVNDPALFYTQIRGLIDFMFERSANEKLFFDIATALAAGQDIESWLATSGKKNGLPVTIDALEKEWTVWLESMRDKASTAPAI